MYCPVTSLSLCTKAVVMIVHYFFCSGHVNHSIFWKNLAPTSVSLFPGNLVIISSILLLTWLKRGFFIYLFLQAGGGEPPHGSLGWAIDQHFGSIEKLIAKMNAEGAAVQGSGWVVCSIISSHHWNLFFLNTFSFKFDIFLQWLAVDKELKRLVVETTANQV